MNLMLTHFEPDYSSEFGSAILSYPLVYVPITWNSIIVRITLWDTENIFIKANSMWN